MASYRLDLEYEGTRYRGWQIQATARSIAGELQRALGEIGLPGAELGGSGRTDAGVHAVRQTAHLRLRQTVEPGDLQRELNDRLPADIHVLALRRAHDRFHARHDAASRSYVYQIARRRTALAKRFVWWVKRSLDEQRLADAAALLEGRHDFRRFCEQPAQQKSTIVVVESVEVAREGDLLLVRFVASHFLWKMVRRLTGALVRAGAGELGTAELSRLLEEPDAMPGTEVAAWTAPPSGLFLERVIYPGERGLDPLAPITPLAAERELASGLYIGGGSR